MQVCRCDAREQLSRCDVREERGGVHKRNGFTIQATDLPGTYSSHHGHEHGVTLAVPPELGTQYTS